MIRDHIVMDFKRLLLISSNEHGESLRYECNRSSILSELRISIVGLQLNENSCNFVENDKCYIQMVSVMKKRLLWLSL